MLPSFASASDVYAWVTTYVSYMMGQFWISGAGTIVAAAVLLILFGWVLSIWRRI